jgi:hypothetical protein
MERAIKNHGQMLALLDALRLVMEIPKEMVVATREALVAAALERQSAVSAENAQANEFWEVYEYLETTNGGMPVVNHSRDPGGSPSTSTRSPRRLHPIRSRLSVKAPWAPPRRSNGRCSRHERITYYGCSNVPLLYRRLPSQKQ